MRIVGGKYKGRIFNPGNNFRARPTTDMAKEGLFNILTNRINFEETDVLDLFSGTGSISLEFISRGSRHVTLIESDPVHFRFILQTINSLEIENITPVKTDVFRFLNRCDSEFDLIFADPPFNLKRLDEIPDLIFNASILKPGAILILEHPKNYNFSNHLHFKELRNYGSVHFSFFQ
ncbi:MAG: 16S rRNA (guanine(966)-N(2))-methyltransferase RsmD [Prolixibacteraceae bacterium]|nr:16S rRNA (guanine(966)-N(2))-methyltransferase RsmD [Prolixibacteraceae bacterium]